MNDDKTYMWLIIIAFVGLIIATGFAALELSEFRAPIDSTLYKKDILAG